MTVALACRAAEVRARRTARSRLTPREALVCTSRWAGLFPIGQRRFVSSYLLAGWAAYQTSQKRRRCVFARGLWCCFLSCSEDGTHGHVAMLPNLVPSRCSSSNCRLFFVSARACVLSPVPLSPASNSRKDMRNRNSITIHGTLFRFFPLSLPLSLSPAPCVPLVNCVFILRSSAVGRRAFGCCPAEVKECAHQG